MSKQLNRDDILNSIDLNKINHNEKKKRGRPKKSHQVVNPNLNKYKIDKYVSSANDQDEIILHLPLSSHDISSLKNVEINLADIENDKGDEDINDREEDDKREVNVKKQDNSILVSENANKSYAIGIIKKLKEENEELKKYLSEITPMYFTDIKFYPSDLKLFDRQNNILVPKKTNICCWWCTYPFENLPCYIPEKYSQEGIYVFGCFCSFNCAGAYNLSMNEKVWERYSLLKLLYFKINKDKITSIKDIEINPAGPRELLEKFGGIMKINEYRKNSKIIGREYHKLLPPFIPMNFGFEEITNSKINKIVNINLLGNCHQKSDVVVKRNKPLNNLASKEIDQYIE